MNESSEILTCNLKTPWYFSTPLICVLFATWFVYGIPVLLGIVLIIAKTKYEKKKTAQVEELLKLYADAQSLLTPEMQDAHKLQILVDSLHEEEASAHKNLGQLPIT